ncbi:MAG: aminotransferase class III-fold pyridoxal phosphate-dependent enzyme [Pseudomonadales bacterium]|nr:aminotransferase class III-fold pyridoxal phosphate-dependent enzyme [Pseudomonadales bacterium]
MNLNADVKELDRRTYLHPFTDFSAYQKTGGRIFTAGNGIYLKDVDGNETLDGMSGLWCTNLGYSQTRIIEAITQQLERLPFYNSFFNCTSDVTAEMAATLVDYLPNQFSHVFFTNSGSEANDTNIRLLHRYFDLVGKPAKKLIISRRNAYHGSTIAAASLGGMTEMHKQFRQLDYIHHVDQPYWFDEGGDASPEEFGLQLASQLANKIDELGAENVAAFIAEPVQGAGGVIIPPSSYWPAVSRVLKERDVLLISDEVICGFGRTGQWFGCETFGTEPDLMTFAKGVTNGYQPLGGVAVSSRIADVLTTSGGEFAHGFTYSGHPVACAAGLATLSLYRELDTRSHVLNDIAPYWREKFNELSDHPIVGEARTLGMLGALELVRESDSRVRLDTDGKATVFCRNASIGEGLMVRAVRDTIISAPPLICSRADIDAIFEKLLKALDLTAAHYGVNSR